LERIEAAQSHIEDVLSAQKPYIQKMIYAGFFPRFWAYLIDLIVLWSLNQIVTNPLINGLDLQGVQLGIEMFSITNIATSALFFAYFAILTYYFQATLGKMIMGLSVDSGVGTSLGWKQVLYREWIGRYINVVLIGIPYVVVLFAKKNRGIHDYFSDTFVIKERLKPLKDAL